ncbi:MAG TPA: hypothetical protein PK760_07745 [Flavobacteriales bacterium]|nr:hypothetical protein [Flavobacteriales bacterium]
MRFLDHEHADVVAELKRNGLDERNVLFVKRRGRLHVELPGRDDAFAFFREKSAKLDEHGQWQEHVEYYIGNDKKNPCHWEQVVAAFKSWLAER